MSLQNEKIQPQATDVEAIVLGSILIKSDCLVKISTILNEDSFYTQEHRIIFKAIRTLQKSNEPIDILTVKNKVQKQGDLEKIGGAYFITQLTTRIASTANIVQHAMIVQQKYIQRQAIKQANELLQMAYDETIDVFETIQQSNKANTSLNELVAGNSNEIGIDKSAQDSAKALDKRIENYALGIPNGIPSGVNDIDRLTNNFQNNNLIVVGARPSMGKTAVLIAIAKNIAKQNKYVRIYELEMSSTKLTDRMIISESGVDADAYAKGSINSEEAKSVTKAIDYVEKLQIKIDDSPIKSVLEIHSACLIAKKKGECDIVFIDYLQLVKTDKANNKIREQEVAELSRALKIMAKDLDIPVILLAQLNRGLENRPNKRPILSDLRESGAVEQDADIVGFIYRDEKYGILEDENGNSTIGVGEFIVAKNREGSTGTAKFKYNQSMTIIEDLDENSGKHPSMPIEDYKQSEMPINEEF